MSGWTDFVGAISTPSYLRAVVLDLVKQMRQGPDCLAPDCCSLHRGRLQVAGPGLGRTRLGPDPALGGRGLRRRLW